MAETTRLTAYDICMMKTDLEKEDVSGNKKLGRYVEIYLTNKEGVFCKTGTMGLGHSLGMFEIRLAQLKGLEKAFTDAGYEIRRHSLATKELLL